MVMIRLIIEQIYIFFRRNGESTDYIFAKAFSCAGFIRMKSGFGKDGTMLLTVSPFSEERKSECSVIFATKKEKAS